MARKHDLTADDSLIFFEARTEMQEKALEVIKNHDLTFLIGPAGTGKTHLAVVAALLDMQEQNFKKRRQVQKIVITRPVVEAGEKLGALPGEVNEKVHPYMLPIYDCVSKLVRNSEKFIDDNFEIAPLAYMRGRTFELCVTILDEAQNCTIGQLLLFLTRMGSGSKMIIAGDLEQSDIGRVSGLKPWVDALRNKDGIGFVEFTEEDIVRHPLVKTILKYRPK